MKLAAIFRPKPTISEQEMKKGLRWLTYEGMASLGFNSITTSGLLAAYALLLGATNLQIGIIAAIPFLMHILQIPASLFVERLKKRKLIAITTWFFAQLLWIPIALIPVLIKVPNAYAVSILLMILAMRGVLHAFSNSSWNSWVRDLVPQNIFGRFFSRRLALAALVGIIFGIGSALYIDYWNSNAVPENVSMGYTHVLLFGALCLGLMSPLLMSFIPEPQMQALMGGKPSLRQYLGEPFKDINYRRLLLFLFVWCFASNLAIPFFAVYMLVRLSFPLTWVISLSVVGQIFNILFLRVWGSFIDKYGNKPILSLSSSLYLLAIVCWIFTTMPERHFLTVPLLVIIHIFAGIANAGVTVALGTIALKLSPKGHATTYLSGAAIATNIGTGTGPLIGGVLADVFSTRQLSLNFSWTGPSQSVVMPAVSISGFDFLFVFTFILGLISLIVLRSVKEEGEVENEVVLQSLMMPMREMSGPLSSVPSYNLFSNFPFSLIRKVRVPGFDIAFGVTMYQISEMARLAATTAVRGRRLTRRFISSMERAFSGMINDKKAVQNHGQDLTRELARGAMHVLDNEKLSVEQVTNVVATDVIKLTTDAGLAAEEAIVGASQGIIEGAFETQADMVTAVQNTISASKDVASVVGMSEDDAVAMATQGILQAGEGLGSDIADQVIGLLDEEADKQALDHKPE